VSSRPLSATFSEGESGDGYNKSSGVGCDLRGSIFFNLTLDVGDSTVIISLFFVVFVVLRVFLRLSCGGVVFFLFEGLLLDILPYGADWRDGLGGTKRPMPELLFIAILYVCTVLWLPSFRSAVLGEEAKDGSCFGSIVLEHQLHVRVWLDGLEVPEPVGVHSEPAGSIIRRVALLRLCSFAVDVHCLLVGFSSFEVKAEFCVLWNFFENSLGGGCACLVALTSR